MAKLDNKTFALIAIIVLSILQITAWLQGFNGQFTVVVTGVLTYLFGLVTGKEFEKRKNK